MYCFAFFSSFFKFEIFFIVLVFPDPGARTHPKGFDIKLLTIFIGHGIVFQPFNVKNFSNLLIKPAFFSKFFLKIFVVVQVFSASRTKESLLGFENRLLYNL